MRYPNIEAERARRGWTKKKLAELLGVKERTIYNWISTGNWPVEKIRRLSELFDVSVDYLIENPEPKIKEPLC